MANPGIYHLASSSGLHWSTIGMSDPTVGMNDLERMPKAARRLPVKDPARVRWLKTATD